MGGTLGKKLDKPLSASPDSSVQKSLAERKPLQKIPLKQFLQGDAETKDLFMNSLLDHGHAVLVLDVHAQTIISTYLTVVKRFFKLSTEIKNKSSMNRRDRSRSTSPRKSGSPPQDPGYCLLEEHFEYLKLSAGPSREEKHRFPRTPADLQPKFLQVHKMLREVARIAFLSVASHMVPSLEDCQKNDTYINTTLSQEVEKKAPNYSSLTVNHYLPCTAEQISQRRKVEALKQQMRQKPTSSRIASETSKSWADDDEDTRISSELDRLGEEEQAHVEPLMIDGISDLGLEEDDTLQLACRLHALPGLLGLYVASATPGLQVQDKMTSEFLNVEESYEKGVDLICIPGQKLRIYGQHAQIVLPTAHRIQLPADTERLSMMFELDVPDT